MDALPELLRAALPHAGIVRTPSLAIVSAEKTFLRTWTSVMTTVVIEPESNGCSRATVVTGGGEYGVFGVTWGSQEAHSREVLACIGDLCRTRSCELDGAGG